MTAAFCVLCFWFFKVAPLNIMTLTLNLSVIKVITADLGQTAFTLIKQHWSCLRQINLFSVCTPDGWALTRRIMTEWTRTEEFRQWQQSIWKSIRRDVESPVCDVLMCSFSPSAATRFYRIETHLWIRLKFPRIFLLVAPLWGRAGALWDALRSWSMWLWLV